MAPASPSRLFRLFALLITVIVISLVATIQQRATSASLSASTRLPVSALENRLATDQHSLTPESTTLLEGRKSELNLQHRGDNCDRTSTVVLAGNRPVGTYLCSYFTSDVATPFSGGCKIACFEKSFTCEIHDKASPSMLLTADIVVNHFGPVPRKDAAGQKPYLTVFYNGESNSSDPKRAKASYHGQYDMSVSFHRSRPLYFTWTKRFEGDFKQILDGTYTFPKSWSNQRAAIAILVSRCKKGGREHVIRGLAAHFPVYSFGKCARTHTIEQEHPECAAISGRYPQKMCIFAKYKFVLALDNSKEVDYVTEKVYHALLAGSIPVYDGAPNANAFLPGGWSSVVRLEDFTSASGTDFAALGKHLHELSEQPHPSQLGWHHVERELDWGEEFVDNLHHQEPTCQICQLAQEKRCRLTRHQGAF